MVPTVVHMVTPETLSRAISALIADELAAADIPLRTASETTGIPRTTLRRRLIGASPLTMDELAALLDLLGITLTEAARRTEVPDQAQTNRAAS